MSDTYEGECRVCGEDTDLINGTCQECQCLYDDFEDWRKQNASKYMVSEQDKELFVAFLRTL